MRALKKMGAGRRCIHFLRDFSCANVHLRPNLPKWLERSMINLSMSVLDSKTNAPSYTYIMQKR